MSIFDQRIALLREQVQRLQALLDDESAGNHSWMVAVAKRVDEVNAIMDGKRDRR